MNKIVKDHVTPDEAWWMGLRAGIVLGVLLGAILAALTIWKG